MVGTLSKNLNLLLAWSHMDFWKQTKINCHYILTIILHLISLSHNIGTFLLKHEYYLDFVNRYTTVDTSWARITYPSGIHQFISSFCSALMLTLFSFLSSVLVNCLFLSLLLSWSVDFWFSITFFFWYLLTICNAIVDFVVIVIL